MSSANVHDSTKFIDVTESISDFIDDDTMEDIVSCFAENYLISEQIQIKQTELDEITFKIKSMQQLPAENYLISEQIQIKQDKFQTLDKQIHSKTTDLEKKVREKNIKIQTLDKQIHSKTTDLEKKVREKNIKIQTLDKQIHSKTTDLEKKVREKNALLRSLRKQCDKYEQQKNKTFLFLNKIRKDIKTLQSEKFVLDKKINIIKESLNVFDISDNVIGKLSGNHP